MCPAGDGLASQLLRPLHLGDTLGLDGDAKDGLGSSSALTQLIVAWSQASEDGGEAHSRSHVSSSHSSMPSGPWRAVGPDLDLLVSEELAQVHDERPT
jgi:hypothetical protein